MNVIIKTLNGLIIAYVIAVLMISVAAINSKKQINFSSTLMLGIRYDYLLHALLFIPWMVLTRWRWKEKKGVGFFMNALGAGLLLAAVSEGVQVMLPFRSFNVFDLLSNCAGLVMGG